MMRHEKDMAAKTAWAKLSDQNVLRRELIYYLEGVLNAIRDAACDATIPEEELRKDMAASTSQGISAINKVWELIEKGGKVKWEKTKIK